MNFINRLWSDEKDRQKETRVGEMDSLARDILRVLEEDGFEAYVVGGCVRDLLLKKIPHDWDITTSATPDEVIQSMEKRGWMVVDGHGRRFGTVIVVMNHQNYEVTTFRSDVYGMESHRPEEVHFAQSLREDLSRRDFTINAMALDRNGVLYDYFHGLRDLESKRLRTVGDAKQRFREDALRLFRACRFLGQLDFMAETDLVKAFPSAFPRVKGLSLERVREEIGKLLLTDHAARGMDLLVRTGLNECQCTMKRDGLSYEVDILPELSHLVGLPQEKEYHQFDGWYHSLAALEKAPKTAVMRWGALLHDVGKGMPEVRQVREGRYTDYGHDIVGAAMAEAILTRWDMPKPFVRRVSWIVKNHMRYHYFAHTETASVVRWIRQMARSGDFRTQKEMMQAVGELEAVCQADALATGKGHVDTENHATLGAYMKELCKTMPVTTKELNYDARVIDALGDRVGDGLKNMLARVQNGNLENRAEVLYEAALRYRRRRDEEDT